jgi:ribosomal protein L16 Arg81 hydroxylase
MISTFQDLIAPLAEGEFLSLLYDRTLKFRASSGGNRFEGLLDWDTLRGLIERGVIPPDRFKLTRNGNPVPSRFYLRNGKIDVTNFTALIAQGVSVVTNPIQWYVPALQTLCNDIAARIGEVTEVDAIVTSGSGGALRLHYDAFDLVVLQMQGSKRWRIYGPPVIDPVKGMPEQKPPENAPLFDETLRPGDFLFLPAGFWHHCDNGPDLSLHVAIMLKPPTGWHAIQALLSQLPGEELFRVRLTRFGGAAERTAHEEAVKARLIEKIGQMSMSELAAAAAKRPAPQATTSDQTGASLET